MFTQDEASAMIMAGKLVERLTDQSVQVAFNDALMKIKSVLNEAQKDHLEILHDHIEVFKPQTTVVGQSGRFLTELQRTAAEKRVIELAYVNNQNENTSREVEPIGLLYYSAAWHLIAWCRLRNGYRDFRTDRINEIRQTTEVFKARSISTMQEYFSSLQQANVEVKSTVVLFNKNEAQYIHNSRHYFGFVEEEELDDQVRMKFVTSDLNMMARWLLSYGSGVEVEESEELKNILKTLVEELQHHYEASHEQLQTGISINKITPFWRVVDEKSPLNKKLSFGEDFVKSNEGMKGFSPTAN
jgi:predicted DNA-binding transcriptional regulator YafY